MKKGASRLLKNIVSLLSSITRSKSLAIKSKVEAMKAKVVIFSLLKNKKLPLTLKTGGSISHKIHALLLGGSTAASQEDMNESSNVDNHLQLVLHKANSLGDGYHVDYVDDEEDNKYPDLRHSLFDEEDDPNASVIDLVKNSMEHGGEDFRLEDEIDHVADLFIKKFHKRMRLQKLESFKRFQEMLERSS